MEIERNAKAMSGKMLIGDGENDVKPNHNVQLYRRS